MKRLFILAILFPMLASAVDVNVSWTHPTQYNDNSVLELVNIKDTNLQYGTCTTATTPTFGTLTAEKDIAGPANTGLFTGVLAGTYCFRARTTDLQGRVSGWSTVVKKAVVDIKPKPPTGIVF